MPPRSTQRVRPTQSARRKAPATSQSSDGARLEAARKSRRIARKVGEAGSSGWRHDDEGDERDLVPPSDVEEYEEWEQRRKRNRERSSVGRHSSMSEDSLESRTPSRHRSTLSPSSPALSDRSHASPPTSQTIPLTAEQVRLWDMEYGDPARVKRSAKPARSVTSLDEESDDGEEIVWPRLVLSGQSRNSPVERRSARSPFPLAPTPPSRSPPLGDDIPDAGVLPEEYESPPLDEYPTMYEAGEEEEWRDPSPDRDQETIPKDERLEEDMDQQRNHTPTPHRPPTPAVADQFDLVNPALNGLSPISRAESQTAIPVQLHPPSTPVRHQPRYPVSSSPVSANVFVFTPIKGAVPSQRSVDGAAPFQDGQTGSPLVEAQVGSHNQRDWRRRSESLSHTSTRPAEDDPSTPVPGKSPAHSAPRRSSRTPQPQDPLPHVPVVSIIDEPPPDSPLTVPPPDPALQRFRTARTFRTRTVLQLQPYTKERQIYEAALKKGGLKKGKHAVARARDISPSEEDNEPEGGDEDSSDLTEPEAIVIGDTPVLKEPRPPRKPKKLIEADYDAYFLEYGQTPNDDDEEAAKRLQAIARQRLQAEKEERRRRKDAERVRKKFERLIRKRQGDDAENSDEAASPRPATNPRPPKATQRKRAVVASSGDESPSPKRAEKPAKPTKPTSRQPRTYGKKDRVPPSSTRRAAAFPPVRVRSASARSVTRLETPSDVAEPLEPAYVDDDWDGGGFADLGQIDGDIDANMGSATPTLPSASAGTRENKRTEGSFFVDDLGPKARGRQSPSLPSDGSASESEAARDKRQKIARRMLPAAMLQRLEREAANRERQKEKRRQEARKMQSPAGPGRAVKRRGGAVDTDVLGFVGSEPESSSSAGGDNLTPRAPQRQAGLVITSDSEGSSSSSQAHEDYAGAQSIAHLYDGDFETLIAGKRQSVLRDTKRKKATKKDRSHARRPALGLAKRALSSSATKPRSLHQARLDFQVEEQRSPLERRSKKRKTPSKAVRDQRPRPVIRLDDHVIFSGADFAFDDDAASSVQSQPKRSKHTPGRQSGRQAAHDHVDAGVGKARSWANFDKFPIDFGISPLPSGLYCSAASYVGDGSLQKLVALLSGASTEESEPESVSAYGVELRSDMSPAAISSVVPVLFDSMKDALLGYANDTISDVPSLAPIEFLGGYLTTKRDDSSGDTVFLRLACEQAANGLSEALDSLHEVNGGRKRAVRDVLLSARLMALDMACRVAGLMPDTVDSSVVGSSAISLLRFLLSSGFDKTMRPLKKILKGESESPEVDDGSILAWISALHILETWSNVNGRSNESFLVCLERAIDTTFQPEETGPIASERIWFLVFGLCAISQFEDSGRISAVYNPRARWQLVRRAISLIRISHQEEVEEGAQIEQLKGRDRYIKAMIARCIKLSAIWQWSFDRESFSVATKDLGVIFKDRQHRNLPTEPPVDYPEFITHFDMTLTAAHETKRESAFELYLRLVCVAASDIIASAQTLTEAQKAEKDVQKLIMSIIPVSPVKFNRVLPPTLRQVGQLINRYSTMIAACYFSPSLLPWLLANSKKWISFENADFESRQVCIRGLMYLAVACRHHGQSLDKVVDVLAGILGTLQTELDNTGKPSVPAQAPSKLEIERTMVLVVACFRQIIQHHSFDPEAQTTPVYPDPCLLHSSWTGRIFALDLASDLKCGTEVIATIQAFLDVRSNSLPRQARQRREARAQQVESQDDYSFGIDFSTLDLVALGGEAVSADPAQRQDEAFASIINTVISPSIYRLLSDMLPAFEDETMPEQQCAERHLFVSKLAKCWSDCAAVIVVEHNSKDGWTPYVGPLGKESWQRLRNEQGRLQVGLHFMLNVALVDPGCYEQHEEVFLTLLFQSIVTDRLSIEHQYLTALFAMPRMLDTALFAEVALLPFARDTFDRAAFMDRRSDILEAIFSAVPSVLGSSRTPGAMKTLVYRCINLLASAMVTNYDAISSLRVIHKESYHAFATTTARALVRLAGEYINVNSIPKLKAFV